MTKSELTDQEVEILQRKSGRIKELQAQFQVKMNSLRARQRKILETAFNRIDSEKIDGVRNQIKELK